MSGAEILVVICVALCVLGPNQLPEVAKFLGKCAGVIQKNLDRMKDTVYTETERMKLQERNQKAATADLEYQKKLGENTEN